MMFGGRRRDSIGIARGSLARCRAAFLVCSAILMLAAGVGLAGTTNGSEVMDFFDPTYGARVRQLYRPGGNEHNIYHYRNPWNADNSYMVGIQAEPDETDWRVVLYDGEGIFVKELFPITEYDWRLVWDRSDPDILYTWKGSNLYRFNVETDVADLLKSFAPLTINPNGPSLNQAGDRILVITSDKVFRSYHLPDMGEERTFTVTFPPGCNSGWDKERYIGYLDYVLTGYRSADGTIQATCIYDDSGNLFHLFDGIGLGHSDFSPDGQWAYPKMPEGGRGQPWTPLEIHVVNIDGTNDRVVYSMPREEAVYVQSFHITWPDEVNDWFVAGFFPSSLSLPSGYAPLLDEIVQVYTDGRYEYLARTGTACTPGKPFWSQCLPTPSSDGTRITFNSDCSNDVAELGCMHSGTIDQFILYTEDAPTMRQIMPWEPAVSVGEYLHFATSPGNEGQWSLADGQSGGSVDEGSGLYRAGFWPGGTDIVSLSIGTDSATTTVMVNATPRPPGQAGPATSMDVTGGGVGIDDVIFMLKCVVGMENPTASKVLVADFNWDGGISLSDVINALRVVVGLAPVP